jgi:YD repeat-containing protein
MANAAISEDANAGKPQKKFKGSVSVETGGGVQQRWSEEKAWAWYKAQPLLIGFNYLPATAINSTEMWQADTFDPKTIDAELALAGQNGFNCARVFLQYLVWENDPKGHEKRLEEFLAIAKKGNIGVRLSILTLFGDASPYTTATYDANGNVLTQTDASGNTTAFEYDHLGRLKTATQPETDQHDAPVTTYVYDAAGEVAEVHAPGPDAERVTYGKGVRTIF